MIYIVVIFQVFGLSMQSQNPVYGPHGELLTGNCVQMSTMQHPDYKDSVPDFRPSVQIDDSTLLWCRGPFLHVLEDYTIYAILQSGPGSGLPRYIRFTSSNDTGKTWLNPNVVIHYHPDVITGYPSMAVGQDGGINVVWAEPYNNGILFSRSVDNGLTWPDTVRVDDGNPVGYRRLHPDITCFGDTLFVCWTEGPSGSPTWYPWVAISTNAGTTWINENQISCVPANTSTNWPRSYIRYDSLINRLFVMWPCNDGDIYVARSSDGTTWQASTVTIDNVEDAKYSSMDIGPDGKLYVVWNEARFAQFDTDIFLSKSTDGGVNWSNSILVNDQAGIGANQYEPHISVDVQGIIHVAWIECIPFGSMTNAYYTVSFDDCNTWLEPNLTVTDILYTISPSVPYSLTISSDTTSYAYVGWTYDFSGVALNFFSTNCPDEVGIEENKIISPSVVHLDVFPNPFSKLTKISFSKNHEAMGNAHLKIYDISGRLIRQWDYLTIGLSNQISWEGTDLTDCKVPAGIYFLEFAVSSVGTTGSREKTGDFKETRKLLLIR